MFRSLSVFSGCEFLGFCSKDSLFSLLDPAAATETQLTEKLTEIFLLKPLLTICSATTALTRQVSSLVGMTFLRIIQNFKGFFGKLNISQAHSTKTFPIPFQPNSLESLELQNPALSLQGLRDPTKATTWLKRVTGNKVQPTSSRRLYIKTKENLRSLLHKYW